MVVLHIRNVPDSFHDGIQELAREEKCSPTADVTPLLAEGIKVRESRRDRVAIVARINREAQEITLPGHWTDSATRVREARERRAERTEPRAGCQRRRKGLRARGTFRQSAGIIGRVCARRR